MASPTQWIWVWVYSGSWWWTGKLGVLQFMQLQRVRHDWATELNWTELWLFQCPASMSCEWTWMLPCLHQGPHKFHGEHFSSSMKDELYWGSLQSGRQRERLCNTPRKIDDRAYMPCHAHGKQAGISLNRLRDVCTNPHLYISLLFLSVLRSLWCLGSNILSQCKLMNTYIHTHILLWKTLFKVYTLN